MGRDLTFSEKLLSNLTEMICGHGDEKKLKYPYPLDSKIIQMPYCRAKAINQISAGLTLIIDTAVDRCIIVK